MKLRKMFGETGRSPVVIMSLTPSEFAFLFPLVNNDDVSIERIRKVAMAHCSQNDRRGRAGLIPKVSDELRLRIEGKR